jgi:ubiquinol-cytochrome c reductase cytochrome c subunit
MRTSVSWLSARRRHPLAALFVILLGLVAVGSAYAAISPGRQAAADASQSFAVKQGKQLYLEGCSTCHGLGGEGTTYGPSLIGVGAAAVDFQVGTGRMPARQLAAQVQDKPPVYDEKEVAALAAFVGSLAPGPAIPSASDLDYADADLAEGGQLFRTNCASCHNFSGQGGALTRGKYAPSLEGATPKEMFEAMLTGPQSMPVFPNGTLTVKDKQQIVKYVQTITHEPNAGGAGLGRVGPVTEGLLVWVGGLGLLVGVAVWLTKKVL